MIKISLLLLLSSFLMACSSNNDVDELKAWAKKVKKQKPHSVQSMPKFKDLKVVEYAEAENNSPFQPAKISSADNLDIRPDANRPKEELEKFSLDSLNMVGVLQQKKTVWAIIAAPDGTLYHVSKGAYLGKNYGQVDAVLDSEVKITETILGRRGAWEKRVTALAIK